MVTPRLNLDEDALVAAADLVGRTGATGFEIGYLYDGVPIEDAGWYAHAQFQGARITVENQPGPVEAANGLVVRLLQGGRCRKCGGLITLTSSGALVYESARLIDGTRWDQKDAESAGRCRWTRMGAEWVAGCQPQ